MYFISLSVTLFIIIAAVHLLAKVRNENLGIFSKLVSYLVLLVALLMLCCQLLRGVDRMERGEGKCKKECKREMMMGGKGDHHMMVMKKCRKGEMKGKCTMGMHEEACCKMGGKEGECCGGKDMNCEMECCKDSTAHAKCKGMEKEVEIIIEEKE